MHHEVDCGQELFEFTELIGFFGGLVDVEPTFSYFSEGVLDDLFKSSNPTLFSSVEPDLGHT